MRLQQRPMNASLAIGANIAAEHRAAQMAALIDVCAQSARRIIELTEVVADLRERVAQLEGEGRG